MKALAITIFLVVLISFALFAVQVVKNSNLLSLNITERTPAASKLDKTFIEVQRNISFSYPGNWIMVDPKMAPESLPLYRSGSSTLPAYAALGAKTLPIGSSWASEIEEYSENIPMQKALNALAGSEVKVVAGKVRELTFPHSVSGFIVEYSGFVGDQEVVKGRMYFYRPGQTITYAYSAVFIGAQAQNASTTPEIMSVSFINDAEAAFLTLAL